MVRGLFQLRLLVFAALCVLLLPSAMAGINTNQTLVLTMARHLLNGSMNAGAGYADVWIRDTATFLEIACEVNEPKAVKQVLIQFLQWQTSQGEIPDGYNISAAANHSMSGFGPCSGPKPVCKNTAETDQESSLVIAFSQYVNSTGDIAVVTEEVDGTTVLARLEAALQWLINNRMSTASFPLLYGGTTMDWGDVQPEAGLADERMLGSGSHLAMDVYDNALFVLAIQSYMHLLHVANATSPQNWAEHASAVAAGVQAQLWNGQQYRPHKYLQGSPFPDSFDEDRLFCSGSTWVAAQAGFLSPAEFSSVLQLGQQKVAEVNAQGGAVTLGMTIYPPYPQNLTQHMMQPWTYQNGGDWAW